MHRAFLLRMLNLIRYLSVLHTLASLIPRPSYPVFDRLQYMCKNGGEGVIPSITLSNVNVYVDRQRGEGPSNGRGHLRLFLAVLIHVFDF